MSDACPHCGAPLAPAEVEMGGRAYRVGTRPCQCEGAKAERAANLAAAEAERLEDERLRSLRCRERAGIPLRYREAAHPDAPRLFAALDAHGWYLTGGVGSGKTHLACAVANIACDAGWRVRFASGVAMLEAERGSFGQACDGLAPYIGCDLLVLDDLGKERPTEWVLEQLFRVVDGRYNSMRPTVATSQHGRSELARRLARGDSPTAQAIASRLCRTCEVFEVRGGDRRLA